MQKLYYSISDIGKIVDEEQHILRYWEKEFSQIKPRKNRAGNRVYSVRDLAVIKEVKNLLRVEKLTLKVAKDKIKEIDFSNFDTETEIVINNTKANSENTQEQNFNTEINVNTKNETPFSKSDLMELKELLTDIRQLLSA